MKFTLAAVLASSVAASALAGATDGPFTYINTSASAFEAAGFTNLTPDGPVLSFATGDCAGCYSLAQVPGPGPLPLKAFFSFAFDGGTPATAFSEGLFAVMRFNFSDPAFGVPQFINLVNNQAAEAYNINYAPNASCSFADFLDPTVYNINNTVVFRWVPTSAPSVFTFGWDFTGGGFAGSGFPGMSVEGAGSVPAPGAIGLLALAGLAGRRRR